MDRAISELIVKHLHGELSSAEQLELNAWLAEKPQNLALFQQLTTGKTLTSELHGYSQLPTSVEEAWRRHLERYPLNVPRRRSLYAALEGWRKYAAIFLLALGGYLAYLSFSNRSLHPVPASQLDATYDIAPGSQGAILTLSDGSQVPLDSGVRTLAQGATTRRTGTGQLVYQANNNSLSSSSALFNTLATGRGQTYPLTLSDGSRIWLNAASWVRYPVTFPAGERHIELSGEAYLEVKADPAHPFVVTLAGSNNGSNPAQIKVTGTRFNVNNYADEPEMVATLLEGRIDLRTPAASARQQVHTLPLKAGQQAAYQPNGIARLVPGADLEAAVAWKSGHFQFDRASITTIMRQLARWYDVEVVYDGPMPQRIFSGELDRSLTAGEVLKVLEDANVHFRIEAGRRIVVTGD